MRKNLGRIVSNCELFQKRTQLSLNKLAIDRENQNLVTDKIGKLVDNL